MDLYVKAFHQLSAEELYEICRLRVAVFVVEQQCAYQEVDEWDKIALHVFFRDAEGIQAYLRLLPPGTRFREASLGRVLAVTRRAGLGTRIVREGIRAAKEQFGPVPLRLEAQVYVRRMYEKLGFQTVSEEYLEDGIPHIQMLLVPGEDSI